jgi:hypothetical protein
MRNACTPSIVPGDTDQNIYLVMDDLSRLGRVWREADAEHADLETIIEDLLDGQYHSPVGGFNPHEGWSRDGSEDIAREIRRRCDTSGGVTARAKSCSRKLRADTRAG